jgi:hypothetical protein
MLEGRVEIAIMTLIVRGVHIVKELLVFRETLLVRGKVTIHR